MQFMDVIDKKGSGWTFAIDNVWVVKPEDKTKGISIRAQPKSIAYVDFGYNFIGMPTVDFFALQKELGGNWQIFNKFALAYVAPCKVVFA